MDKKESGSGSDHEEADSEKIDISLLTQAAVGYVRDHTASKKMAERFVAEVRVHLGQILAHMGESGDVHSPLGNKATPEAIALMEYITEKKEKLESEKGYTSAQSSAIVLKDELVPLQVVAGMANDSELIASIRKVNSHVISELGNMDERKEDPRLLLKRKKRGRMPGSGKKQAKQSENKQPDKKPEN